MKPETKENLLRIVLIIGSMLLFVFGVRGMLSRPSSYPSALSVTKENGGEPFSAVLGAGIYTGGIDIPVGVYTIELKEGAGGVYSSNYGKGGVSESFEKGGIETFQNVLVDKGVTVTITGNVQLTFSSKAAAVSRQTPRSQTKETYTFSAGNYFAGKDFPKGTYDIVLKSGNGIVYSYNMPQDGMREKFSATDTVQFCNADFSKDNIQLSVSGDVEIELIKSEIPS